MNERDTFWTSLHEVIIHPNKTKLNDKRLYITKSCDSKIIKTRVFECSKKNEK